MNFNEILEHVEMGSAILRNEDAILESTKFSSDCLPWYNRILKSANEWQMYAPAVIKLIGQNITESSLDDLINELNKVVKLTDKDGKEDLLSFARKVKLHTYLDIDYKEQIIYLFDILQRAIGNGLTLKMHESFDYDSIDEAKKRLTMDKMIQQETDKLSKAYKKKHGVAKLSELPQDVKDLFYKELEKVTVKAIQMFKNDDVDLEIE